MERGRRRDVPRIPSSIYTSLVLTESASYLTASVALPALVLVIATVPPGWEPYLFVVPVGYRNPRRGYDLGSVARFVVYQLAKSSALASLKSESATSTLRASARMGPEGGVDGSVVASVSSQVRPRAVGERAGGGRVNAARPGSRAASRRAAPPRRSTAPRRGRSRQARAPVPGVGCGRMEPEPR